MKFLILFSCALAVASAGWAGHGGYHIPVIGHGGVPVETPEVQHARAAHLAALNDAAARAGPYNEWQDNGDHQSNDYSEARYHGPHAYPTTHGIAHVTADGVPIDTPEVAAAKAHHFGAVNEALSYAGHGGHHYRRRRGIYEGHHPHAIHDYNFYGVGHDGRPLDTPVVAHAKAAALAAYDEAAARNGVSGHAGHYGGYYGGYAGVAAIHNGVPVDTPEVQHAKAAHFAAHAAARGHHY